MVDEEAGHSFESTRRAPYQKASELVPIWKY
jgi:hypothetical protein